MKPPNCFEVKPPNCFDVELPNWLDVKLPTNKQKPPTCAPRRFEIPESFISLSPVNALPCPQRFVTEGDSSDGIEQGLASSLFPLTLSFPLSYSPSWEGGVGMGEGVGGRGGGGGGGG